MKFEIKKYDDGYYGIKNVNNDLSILASDGMFDKQSRRILTFPGKDAAVDENMRWTIERFGDCWGIKSVRWNEWIYVGEPMLDGERRHVLAFPKDDPSSNTDMLWVIEKIEDDNTLTRI